MHCVNLVVIDNKHPASLTAVSWLVMTAWQTLVMSKMLDTQ